MTTYPGDNAGGPGLNQLEGGIFNARQPALSPIYPPNADISQGPFARPDVRKAYGSIAKPAESVLSFEAVPDRGIFRYKSITYFPSSISASGKSSAFFVDFERRSKLVVYRGVDSSGKQIGIIEISPVRSKGTHVDFLSSPTEPMRSKIEGSGSAGKSYSLAYPALGGQVGTWKRTRKHGGSRWMAGHYVLIDALGAELAVWTKNRGFSGKIGELKILMPGLGEAALEQIVVSCAAIMEVSRRLDDSSSTRGGVGIMSQTFR